MLTEWMGVEDRELRCVGRWIRCAVCVCDVMCQWPGRGRDKEREGERERGEGKGCAKMPSGEVRARGNKDAGTARGEEGKLPRRNVIYATDSERRNA